MALLAVAFGISCATAPPIALGSGETTVQLQVIGGSTFVSVWVNDSRIDSLFLVDTGATNTVLTPLFATRLKLNVPDDAPRKELTVFGGRKVSVPFIRVTRLTVGTASVANLSVGVYDAVPGERTIDGVLGSDFLHQFRVTVDTGQRVMRLERSNPR